MPIDALANAAAAHDATLADLLGLVMAELMRRDGTARARMDAGMKAIAAAAHDNDRDFALQILRRAAKSAGIDPPA